MNVPSFSEDVSPQDRAYHKLVKGKNAAQREHFKEQIKMAENTRIGKIVKNFWTNRISKCRTTTC